MRGCRRFRIRKPPGRPQQDKQQRQTEAVERAAAQVYRPSPPLSPQAFDSPRSLRKSPPLRARPRSTPPIAEIAARQSELDAPPPRAMPAQRRRARADCAPSMRRRPPCRPRLARPARTSPRWNGTCSRSRARSRRCSVPTDRAVDRRVPQRTCRNPRRHHRGDAAPRDRIDRERNPLAVAPHRRHPPERHRRARRSAGIERALSEIREVLRSLKPAEQLAGYDEAIRNLGAKLDLILRANDDPSTVHQLEGAIAALRSHRLQRRLQRRAGAAVRRRADAVVQGRPARPRRRQQRFLAALEQRIAALTSTLESRERPQSAATIPNSSKARCARCPTASTACRSATTARPPSPISNSACPTCSNGWKPPATIALAQSRPGRGRPAGHPAPSRKPACDALPRSPRARRNVARASRAPSRTAEPGRYRQARTDRHPLQPDRRPTATPRIRSSRSQHARPCGRPPGDDRRRSARGALRSRPPLAPGSNRRAAWPAPSPDTAAAGIAAIRRRSPSRNRPIPPRRRTRISPPRRANSMPPRRRPQLRRRRTAIRRARSAKSWSRMLPRRASRSNPICRRIIRSSRARGRAGGRLAIGAHRGFRKRHQRNSRGQERARQHVELHRRRPPRRPGRRRRASHTGRSGQGRESQRPRTLPRCGEAWRKARRESAVDHHLQDPLAAGRRERGRDRARHLQDGDDAARRRQFAAIAGRGEFERAACAPAAATRRQGTGQQPAAAPAPAPSMTSPTPIGRQS